MSRMPVGRLIVIVVVTLMAFYASAPSFNMASVFRLLYSNPADFQAYEKDKIDLGLDLHGGLDLTFAVKTTKLEELKTAAEILRNRVDLFGGVAMVTVQEPNQIRCQIPIKNPERLRQIKASLEVTDLLTLHEVVQESPNLLSLVPGPDQMVLPQSLPKEQQGKQDPSWFLLKKTPEVRGDALQDAFISFGQFGAPTISLTFNGEGTKLFKEVSERMVGRRLAIVLARKVYMAPVMKSAIPDGRAVIEGSFDIEEARRVMSIMKAGALPAEMKKLAEATVGPTLGEESIRRGLQASKIGFGLVLVYMIFYYKLAGFFAVLALLLNLLLLLTGLKFFGAALTLPGIAGVILTIGMAVDANVIIFERIKEERTLGKSLRGSIAGGFDKALSAVLDSNLTTIITALVLYLLGSGPVKGFAVTLSLGIVSSLFTALFVVKTLLDATYIQKKSGELSI